MSLPLKRSPQEPRAIGAAVWCTPRVPNRDRWSTQYKLWYLSGDLRSLRACAVQGTGSSHLQGSRAILCPGLPAHRSRGTGSRERGTMQRSTHEGAGGHQRLRKRQASRAALVFCMHWRLQGPSNPATAAQGRAREAVQWEPGGNGTTMSDLDRRMAEVHMHTCEPN